MDEIKLKPCPFCGSNDVRLRKGMMFNGAVHCNSCTADVVFEAVQLFEEGGDWRQVVTNGWNRRVGDGQNS